MVEQRRQSEEEYCLTFFPFNRTPGKDLETRLNRDYGPGNAFYEDFCRLVKLGVQEGWAASGEIDGERYRRGRVGFFFLLLCTYLLFFSGTTLRSSLPFVLALRLVLS